MRTQDDLYHSGYGDQYLVTLQFELQREKQKNKILEERLRNKQIFIVQMKKMQGEIELLSENCRFQLQQQRKKREYLQKTTIREYLQTISELQHKISYLQQQQNNKKVAKFDNKMIKNKSVGKIDRHRQVLEQKSKQAIRQTKQREQIIQTLRNFTNRFLQMFLIYNNDEYQGNLKKQLKYGWKWIKQVVKEWQSNQNYLNYIFTYAQRCEEQSEKCQPQEILKFKKQTSENRQEEP